MGEKITILKLAQLLAAKSGRPLENCEEVVRALFREVGSALQAGENAKVKGFGTFKISMVEARKSVDVNTGEDNEIPAHNRITFIPAKELAAAVNAPFEMFETVVLEEKVTEDSLMQAEAEGNELSVETLRGELIIEEEKRDEVLKEIEEKYPAVMNEVTQPTAAEVDTTTDKDDALPPMEDINEKEIPAEETPVETTQIAPAAPMQDSQPETINGEAADEALAKEDDTTEVTPPAVVKKKRSQWWWFLIAGLLTIAVAIGILWWLDYDLSFMGIPKKSGETKVASAVLTPADAELQSQTDSTLADQQLLTAGEDEVSGAESDVDAGEVTDVVPTQPSDAPVYDTVSDTRYLTMIAKEHYGNFHLWPYIYKENEKILGHPNRIRPGTRVVIPPLSKYGVDPKNKADIDKAKQLGVEIYKKFDK